MLRDFLTDLFECNETYEDLAAYDSKALVAFPLLDMHHSKGGDVILINEYSLMSHHIYLISRNKNCPV
jgi:hypothetical protein